MKPSALLALPLCLLASGSPAPAIAQAPGVNTAQDLSAVIALQGQPCGAVVEVQRQAENDFVVRCADGNRYRVFVDAQRRTRVEKR